VSRRKSVEKERWEGKMGESEYTLRLGRLSFFGVRNMQEGSGNGRI